MNHVFIAQSSEYHEAVLDQCYKHGSLIAEKLYVSNDSDWDIARRKGAQQPNNFDGTLPKSLTFQFFFIRKRHDFHQNLYLLYSRYSLDCAMNTCFIKIV